MEKAKEDYLSLIYKLQSKHNRSISVSELASALKISKPSVSGMIRILARNELVFFEPYKGISLTSEGIVQARKVVRRHQILEVFFFKFLNLKKRFHEEAHNVEHAMSDETAEHLNEMVGNPCTCPDGNPIPITSSKISRLCNIASGSKFKVLFSKVDDVGSMKRLNALGLVPGADFKVVRKMNNGPSIIRIKGSDVAVGRDICSEIFVEEV